MSYSAFVLCRCYQDGKTTPPPYIEYVKLEDGDLILDYPEPEGDDIGEDLWDEYFKKEAEFDDWKTDACPHKNMELESVNIANSMGMSGFRNFIDILGGEEKFPTLYNELPTANDGCMSSKNAQLMLAELQAIKTTDCSIDKIILRDKKSKGIVMIGDYEDSIPFAFYDKNKMLLLDKNGFYILERKEENGSEVLHILFQSKDFYTVTVEEGKTAYCFHDEADRLIVCYTTISIAGEQPIGERTTFEVVKESVNGSEYWSSVIDSLTTICRAAVISGNAVVWC